MKLFSYLVTGLGLLLGVVGCNMLPSPQSDVVRFFTLSSSTGAPAAVAEGTTVRPVQLDGHLRNREMAVRVAENELIYLDDVRWAEPLGDAVTQMLRARLRSIGGNAVVTVQVQRCELVRFQSNAVQLVATYAIRFPGEDVGTRQGVFTASPRTWNAKEYGNLVGLLRDEVGELGEVIAAALAEKK
jgi:uncharacterized lipoprotein YmbA